MQYLFAEIRKGIIVKGRVWVVANAEAVTFLMSDDC